MGILDLMFIHAVYYKKLNYSDLSLEEKELLFQDLYLLMKNNRYMAGQRNANQELFRVARKKKDYQKAIELANENLALSKLLKSSSMESWVYLDLFNIYYQYDGIFPVSQSTAELRAKPA